MIKNNYERIRQVIESGHIAQMETQYGFILFSSIIQDGSINQGGSIRHSSSQETIEKAYNVLGHYWVAKEDLNDLQGKISVYQKPVWYPKVGDKVEVLERVKQSPGYENLDEIVKEMVGGPFEVKYVGSEICEIYTKDKSGFVYFGYRHIAPWVHDDEEKKERKLMMTDKEWEEFQKNNNFIS